MGPILVRSKIKTMLSFLAGLIGISATVLVVSYSLGGRTEVPSTSTEAAPVARTPSIDISQYPPGQLALERARAGRYAAYKSAANEIQASAIFRDANDATYAAMQRSNGIARNWVGTIDRLSTSHGGQSAYVAIRSYDSTYYRSGAIPSGSSLYQQLGDLKIGQNVYFSGQFSGWDGSNVEGSFTENGSLSKPTFDVEFSSIGIMPIADQPMRSQVAQPTYTASSNPSFDCARARSTPEKLICGDAELASLDRDLANLYSVAKNASEDKVSFQQETTAAWNRRERTCRDKACLIGWYDERMKQYSLDISGMEGVKVPPNLAPTIDIQSSPPANN
jgi:hypothetical protein